MIFPTLALWSSPDPKDALGRIDRALDDRNHRLSAGISVSSRFDQVSGALVVAQGNGRYLRIRHVVESSQPIPKAIREGCLELVSGQSQGCGQLSQVLADLAEPQANLVEQLKCAAGKYVDRVLAVAVCDPGIRSTDFDGRESYVSMCDATRLAELSGVSVIDAFPDRDLAAGGSGNCLESLPYWVLFADRDARVASQSRAVVSVEGRGSGYILPASDGLDSEVPAIQSFETIGLSFLDELVRRCLPASQKLSGLDRLYADGRYVDELRERWEQRISQISNSISATENSQKHNLENRITEGLVDVSQSYLAEGDGSFSNVIRTGVRMVVDQILVGLKVSKTESPNQIFVSCAPQYEASLINQLSQLLESTTIVPTRRTGIDRAELSPTVAAILGLFHIDQMPANVPWITGAQCQRILGRLTPGRPSSWRQLLRVMADYHPAPMKLKDAV